MHPSLNETSLNGSNVHLLMAYVADLELEVDRLRKRGDFLERTARETIRQIHAVCKQVSLEEHSPLAEIYQSAKHLAATLRDLRDKPGYHPAHDQVVSIAVRPLVEKIFRWQQRLAGAPDVRLELELEQDHVEWFPGRLRHILENLLSDALKYRDPAVAESRVRVELRLVPGAYELCISDNGLDLPSGKRADVFELLFRSVPLRAAGLGVGLAVVKFLVEESGGALTVHSESGSGAAIRVRLPHFEIDDYLL
jgi:signal transduction histidine kinase